MRDLFLLVLGIVVAVPICWILFGLANRIARSSRHRRVNWLAGVVGAASAAIAVLGPHSPLPLRRAEDYLALLAVAVMTVGATVGVLLSAVLGWSYGKLATSRLGNYLGRRKKMLIVGALLGMPVGFALGECVLVDPRQTHRWPVILAAIAVCGLFGSALGAVLRRRFYYFVSCGFGVLAIVACVAWAQFYVPIRSSLRFHRAIAEADRLVVRHGGFDCCRPVDGQRVLFEVVDPAQIAEVRQHLQFVKGQPVPGCHCCGYPGLDWYCGETRVALTSVQHWHAIRWRGFKGDARLTEESSQWLKQWLNAHGITSDSPYQY